ncbi:PIR Superfamily Protein [Plasmodium ovale curtisi]|uniref:PIR Superfamily Protein n=1 Tax=Plasmodium ovale curtisi TaxID=864141 RepID=A0A1A8X834_PLAOA|nr:PIR Superfamily Protein [Plasmodium ovale curtisi]
MATTDPDIDSLRSAINYRKLDNGECYQQYCYDVCDALPQELSKYDGIEKLCSKIGFNLNKLSELETFDEFKDGHCSTINYWAYDRLYKDIVYPSKTFSSNSFEYDKFLNMWNKLDQENKCKFDLYNYSEDHFDKMKVIFELAVNYHTIKAKVDTPGFECSEQYEKYINSSVQTYEEVKGECPNGNEKKYCSVLNGIRSDFKDELSKLKCKKTKIKTLPPAKALEGTEEESGGRHAQDTQDEHLQRASSDGSMQDRRGARGETTLDPGTDAQADSSSTGSMTFLFLLLGTLVVFFFFYNFTPFGPWIRTRLLRNKKFRRFIRNNENDELLCPPVEDSSVVAEDDTHHIGYQTLRNY